MSRYKAVFEVNSDTLNKEEFHDWLKILLNQVAGLSLPRIVSIEKVSSYGTIDEHPVTDQN